MHPSDAHPVFIWKRNFKQQPIPRVYYVALLPPIAGVVDGLGLNAELSVQRFYERLYTFYLKVSWVCGFAVSYKADADGLTAAVPGSAWDA